MSQVHVFQKDLALSNSQVIREQCDNLYRHFIPDLIEIIPKPNDMKLQKAGIDTVIRTGTRKYYAEEKVRHTSYGDISLEYMHVPTNPAKDTIPGWAARELGCDFILYVTPVSGILIPYLPFRTAWLMNMEQWKKSAQKRENGFSLIPARNKGYTTWSINVPIHILQQALLNVSLFIKS